MNFRIEVKAPDVDEYIEIEEQPSHIEALARSRVLIREGEIHIDAWVRLIRNSDNKITLESEAWIIE